MKRVLGFTLIEILVAISILAVFVSVGFASYIEFNRRQVVEQAAKTIVSDLRLAQSLATNQQKPSGCTNFEGYFFYVDFPTKTYTIVSLCSVDTRSTYKSATLSGVTLSGLTTDYIMVKFKILGKKTEFVNGNTITITGNTGYAKTITIGVSGDISIN